MWLRLLCVFSILAAMIGWLEVNSSLPSMVAPTTGFSATFAPAFAALAVIELTPDDTAKDVSAGATETQNPSETQSPVETQNPSETRPDETQNPSETQTLDETQTSNEPQLSPETTAFAGTPAPEAEAMSEVVTCVQRFPVMLPDGIENEQAVADRINAERVRYGISPLTLASELTQSARLHSQDMAGNNLLSHYGSNGSAPRQRMDRACFEGTSWGEIIAWGLVDETSAVGWWMNSPVHRAQILNPGFRELGVGYSYNPSSCCKYFWTVNFGSRDPIQPP